MKKAKDTLLRVLLYISKFICTVTLLYGNPATEHPGLMLEPYEEYYMFGGTYWQKNWSSFFVLASILLVDSWLFYFLSRKHREKVVKPLLVTDLVCVPLAIITWNFDNYPVHEWVILFFWLLLHCLKRFLDYYAYVRRDPEKNSLLPLLPKAPDGTYMTVYILVIVSFVVRFMKSDNGVSAAGCLAIAVAMSFALTVYLSRKKAKTPPEVPEEVPTSNEETE